MRSLFALGLLLALGSCTLDFSDDDDDGTGGSGRQCGGFTAQECPSDEYCDYVDDDCGIADGSGFCRDRPLLCPDLYSPVRGADGEIYGNACEAHAAGVDDCGPAPQR